MDLIAATRAEGGLVDLRAPSMRKKDDKEETEQNKYQPGGSRALTYPL